MGNRIELRKYRQIFILPTLGISYSNPQYKFVLGFAWLNVQLVVRFFKK